MKIDAHVHLWRMERGDNASLHPSMHAIYRDREPEDLRPLLDEAGVDRIVVVQAAETLAETLFMAGLSARHEWIAGIVGWIDPASPALEEELAAFAQIARIKGVRPVRADNASIAWMLEAQTRKGWKTLERSGLTLDVLVQNWRELPLAAELCRRHDGMQIVIDHCAKPDIAGGQFDAWAADIAAVARMPHVSCKLSGLLNCARPGARAEDLRRYAGHVIDSFGPERILWASDWPPLELAAAYAIWNQVSDDLLAGLGQGERAMIQAGTASRVYRLD